MVGDGPTTWGTKLLCFVLSNMAVVRKRRATEKTWDVAWRILCWSMEALARGKWPSTDWQGKPFEDWRQHRTGPLCGPYKFAWMQLAADMDELSNSYGLEHFNSKSGLPVSFATAMMRISLGRTCLHWHCGAQRPGQTWSGSCERSITSSGRRR